MKSNFCKFFTFLTMGLVLCSCSRTDLSEMIFIGDSLVAKWDVADAFPGWITVNNGRSGCSVDYLDSFKNDMSGKDVTVIVGTNDSYLFDDSHMREYAERYVGIICGLDASHVYLFSILPRGDVSYDDKRNMRIKKMNDLIKESTAGMPAVTYIDVFDVFLCDGGLRADLYEPDLLHVNASGYCVLKQKLLDSLCR